MINTNLTVEVYPTKLEGVIKISGAKNSALKLLAASLLTDDEIILNNFPRDMLDIKIHIEMLKMLGKEIKFLDNEKVLIRSSGNIKNVLNWGGFKIRNTLLILGALVAKTGYGCVPLPGGCKIGERKYDLHIMLLNKLGAHAWENDKFLCAEAIDGKLKGNTITFPIRSVGATENSLIVASLADGITVVRNPLIQPELLDLVNMLKKMGVNILEFNRDNIVIKGSKNLNGAVQSIIPDNIEAFTYAVGAAITHGELEIQDFPEEHLRVPLLFLEEAGVKFYKKSNSIIVKCNRCYSLDIVAESYPGIKTDLQPFFTILATQSKGISKIVDILFPNRFDYAKELQKLGAHIEFLGNGIKVFGGEKLRGGIVTATDLRGGMALVLAGLVGEERTIVKNAFQVLRGYENLEEKFRSIGAILKIY